jgi:hypothetical protein
LAQKHGVIYHPNTRMSTHEREVRSKQYYAIFERVKFGDFIFEEMKDVITKSDLMHHQQNAWFVNYGRFKRDKSKIQPKTNSAVWKLNPLCKRVVEQTLGVTIESTHRHTTPTSSS